MRNRSRRPSVKFKRQAIPAVAGVYFLRSGVTVKIGCAGDLQRRLQELQTGTFAPLCVVGYIQTHTASDAREWEQALHRQFRGEHVRGEWFRLTEQVVAAIQKHGHLDYDALLVERQRHY